MTQHTTTEHWGYDLPYGTGSRPYASNTAIFYLTKIVFTLFLEIHWLNERPVWPTKVCFIYILLIYPDVLIFQNVKFNLSLNLEGSLYFVFIHQAIFYGFIYGGLKVVSIKIKRLYLATRTHIVPIGSGAHPAYYQMGHPEHFHQGVNRRGREAHSSPHLVPRSWKKEVIFSRPHPYSWHVA
jgi:hypothetical protein